MLRCTWCFKLSPHLDHFNDLEGGIFLMEALEVLGRWIWIFVRVECDGGESESSLFVLSGVLPRLKSFVEFFVARLLIRKQLGRIAGRWSRIVSCLGRW